MFQRLLPFWEGVVRRRATLEHFAYLEKSQWLSVDERRAHDDRALQQLLLHAATNVPYYRELFRTQGIHPRDIRSRKDLVALPLLTREIVSERYEDLVDPAHRG
ncbi:MAG TPA: hypothetical protein VMS65_05800, partial [Polyangiaceae bacterium]|nr:hypothetical protein [Polyangiaceae bacterium]